ncbi:hypothetical protein ACFY1L_46180 [Streptomyces sp. NPDC001663]|uniref:hypothetical protein n=1 Tax=unclassified Streptomyces TaxID=2593676 RepID=UPI00332B8E55
MITMHSLPDPRLDELPDALRQWAHDHRIVLVPAVPETDAHAVYLDAQHMDAAAFCQLAVQLEARVLYQDITRFDAGAFTVIEDDLLEEPPAVPESGCDADLDALWAKARSYQGRSASADLCFVSNGVAHIWQATAPWRTELAEELEAWRLAHRQGAEAVEEEPYDPEAERAREQAMAAQLQELSEFRCAKNALTRREIANRIFPAEDEDGRRPWQLGRAITEAHAAVQLAAKAVYADYEAHLDEIADELVASGVLTQVSGASSRRIKAADFLTRRSGGYPPPGRTLTLLLDRPQLKAIRKSPAADSATLPLVP